MNMLKAILCKDQQFYIGGHGTHGHRFSWNLPKPCITGNFYDHKACAEQEKDKYRWINVDV